MVDPGIGTTLQAPAKAYARLRVCVGRLADRVADGGLGGRFEAGVSRANAQIGTLWSPIARTTKPPACLVASAPGEGVPIDW